MSYSKEELEKMGLTDPHVDSKTEKVIELEDAIDKENERFRRTLRPSRYVGIIPDPVESYMGKAIRYVAQYIEDRLEKTDPTLEYSVYVVWFCKTLQNWKTLISTTLNDQMYYEVTYDGDKKCTYLDAYKKWENVKIPDVTGDIEIEKAETGETHAG